MEGSENLVWEIDLKGLEKRVKSFYVTMSSTLSLIEKGRFWDARDFVVSYRLILITLETMLGEEGYIGYPKVRTGFSEEKHAHLNEMIPLELTRTDLIRCMDSCINYIDRHLKKRLIELNVYPETYANNMIIYYMKEREKVLSIG